MAKKLTRPAPPKGKAKKAQASSTRNVAAKPPSKLDALSALLRAPKGATIEAMMKATGWQAHSVRGALAGALKQRGLVIRSERADGVRVYHVDA